MNFKMVIPSTIYSLGERWQSGALHAVCTSMVEMVRPHLPKQAYFSTETDAERTLMYLLAASTPEWGVVLESGTYLGGNLAIMASANPGLRLHGIDRWDNESWSRFHDYYIKNSIGDQPRTIGAVREWLSDFPNISLHHVDSPNVWYVDGEGRTMEDFAAMVLPQGVGIYIEDCAPYNPTLWKNIVQWSGLVAPGGFMVIKNYRPWLATSVERQSEYYPDVITAVQQVISDPDNWFYIGYVEGSAVFRRRGLSRPIGG